MISRVVILMSFTHAKGGTWASRIGYQPGDRISPVDHPSSRSGVDPFGLLDQTPAHRYTLGPEVTTLCAVRLSRRAGQVG